MHVYIYRTGRKSLIYVATGTGHEYTAIALRKYRAGGSGQAGAVLAGPLFHSSK